MAINDRLAGLKISGQMGTQNSNVKQRFLADLPANVQLNGINYILSGKNMNNQYLNNFVRQAAAKGMTPEQIRLAFIEDQKKSNNPLVIM